MNATTIGQRIKKARKDAGLTLQQVGEAIGVTKTTVQKYEYGIVTKFSRSRIMDLAKVLNTSPAYLLGLTDLEDEQANAVINSFSTFQAKDLEAQPISNWQNPLMKDLSAEEQELLKIYEHLSVRNRTKLLQYGYNLEDSERNVDRRNIQR